MDAEEDYFGDIAVPLDETEEDAANDLTFGDIGDIKAGDDASDAVWKPDHASISEKIEAEKEVLRRRHAQAVHQPFEEPPSPPTQYPPYKFPDHRFLAHKQAAQQQPEDSSATAWDLLQRSLQHPVQQPVHQPQPQQLPQNVQPQLRTGPLPQQIPVHMHRALHPQMQQFMHQPVHQHLQMQGRVNPVPQRHPHLPAHSQAAIQDYQRRLVAHQDQQTRLLLRQHQETAEKQLQEAQRAQQAGIRFDREEFDRHQEATRQRILLDHQNRLRQIQVHVWQMTQQVIQPPVERPFDQAPVLDLRRKLDPLSPQNVSIARSPVEPSFPTISPLGEPAVNGATRANGRSTSHGSPELHNERPSVISNPRMPRLSDEELQKAPRLQEIERQMAEAGLGPNAKVKTNEDTFAGPLQRLEREIEPQGKKKSNRRLESMTDRDQELVFRAHLRQIETSMVYKDDYYNSILTKKLRCGDDDIFSDLVERVEALRLRDKERGAYGSSVRIRGSKRSHTKAANGDSQVASSPPHSDQNMRALANALGTVQSWNPRAPRRVMDFGILEKRDHVDGTPQKSLREDERVHVRQEVERGYDIVATIHDIARGESQKPLGPAIESLMSTLHLAEKRDEDFGKEVERLQSTRFFATMCVIEKGRRYLSHVLELLEDSEKVRVLSAIFENLGMLVFASKMSSGGKTMAGGSQLDLFAVMAKIIQDPAILPQDCLVMFDSFSASHVPHRDAFLTIFRSAVGARLVFLCMQRISAGLSKHMISEEDIAESRMHDFARAFTDLLEAIFEGAEAESRVWEVMASLDSLSSGESRMKYRAELNRLLRAGVVPPPPNT